MTLEQVLADFESEAAVLKMNGHPRQSDAYGRLCEAIRKAMAAYLDRMTEEEAKARSGRSVAWLRAQHAVWVEEGLAGWDGRKRWYRRVVVPRRLNLEAVQAAAKRAARKAA